MGPWAKHVRPVVKWAARVLSLLSIGIVLMFVFGEGLNPLRLGPKEFLLFLFFPLGVGVGLVIGWWREGLGGLIALGSLGLFYIVHAIPYHKFPGGPWFLIFTSPGVLFLLSSLLSRARRDETKAP